MDCVSTFSMRGSHMCATHHWPMDECGGRACRAGVRHFDRAARNIATALFGVACIACGQMSRNIALGMFGNELALREAGLWKERG